MPPKSDESTPKSFETGLAELESSVRELERGDLPLEDSIALFEKGVNLSAACRKQLEEAEGKVEILLKKGNAMKPTPFDAAPAPTSPSAPLAQSDDVDDEDIPF